FIVKRIPISHIPVYCRYFSKLSTKDILANQALQETINTAGEKALGEVERLVRENAVTFDKIIALSKQFAIESGLLQDKQVFQTIYDIESKRGHASMIMLGNAVFSDIPFAGAIELTIC
ncbi:MAG: hypothetical protein KGJ07_09320, partial [Patescibacteria group bacterium]|nr:hypothetical protein [Patescibacteria group bacterium]